MTLHYHGTPITPLAVLYELGGRCLCVSYARPEQIRISTKIAQSVLLDNGAFSAWTRGAKMNWPGYYGWCEEWLAPPTTWAVIPDVVDGDESAQDELVRAWPFRFRGAPVWHMHESLERLVRLADNWPRVCFGSSGAFADLQSDAWARRVDEAFNVLTRGHSSLPWIHMLRGMATCAGGRWPFASVDSTDVARNHSRERRGAAAMAGRWDAMQCPASWRSAEMQEELELARAGA